MAVKTITSSQQPQARDRTRTTPLRSTFIHQIKMVLLLKMRYGLSQFAMFGNYVVIEKFINATAAVPASIFTVFSQLQH